MKQLAPVKCELRLAGDTDMRAVFELANDVQVRKQSCSSESIAWEEHQVWYRKKIADPACLFLIIAVQGAFAGHIRFEADGDNAVVSVSVTEVWRGKGLAQPAMVKALSMLKERMPSAGKVIAYIKPANAASIKFFQACGFRAVGAEIIKGCEAKKYEYVI